MRKRLPVLEIVVLLVSGCHPLGSTQIERDLAESCGKCRLVEASVGEGDAEFAYATVAFRDRQARLIREQWQYQRIGGEWTLKRRMSSK